MAWVSLAKLILFVTALASPFSAGIHDSHRQGQAALRSTQVLLLVLGVFGLSLLWTGADLATALLALAKHGKLLGIVLLVLLIRSAAEARVAMLTFAFAQFGLLMCSWLLVAGLPIPGLPPFLGPGVLFSSYLDQSIIFVVSSAVLWHLSPLGFWPRWAAALFAVAALVSVFQILVGRTAYLVAVAVIALAVMWALPAKLRRAALVGGPLLALAALYFGSAHVQKRMVLIFSDIQNYSSKADISTSSGWRLNAWQRSVEAIAEKPLLGHGVGAWTGTVKRLQGATGTQVFGAGPLSNPHQEYLLWGVELGAGGILLLLLLHISLARDFAGFSTPVLRAGVSVVVAMAIACLFNSTLYDGLIGDYFCVVLGLLLGLGLSATPDTDYTKVRA